MLWKSYKVAAQVLACFEAIVSHVLEETDIDINIKMFANGREQGFNVQSYEPIDRAVSFAENRSSDHIVVYYGASTHFNYNNGQPTLWDDRKSFNYDEPFQAAQWIVDYLIPEEFRED